jgi:hypothetical protein
VKAALKEEGIENDKIPWNTVFQHILSQVPTNSFEEDQKAKFFKEITELFVDCAAPVAKQLIMESKLPKDERSLAPSQEFRGFAGNFVIT